jgi:hypothetical protein
MNRDMIEIREKYNIDSYSIAGLSYGTVLGMARRIKSALADL